MYIAFVIQHTNFNLINERYFASMQQSILNCAKDKNIVHIYFCSNRKVHKFDKFFRNSRIELFHMPEYSNNIDTMRKCYSELIVHSGFDYHWIIKTRPDMLVFDKNLFVNMRVKYDSTHIHARSRLYSGPITLTKNQKSNWDDRSHVKSNSENLLVMDDEMYLIPYPLQFFAFKSSSLGVLPNNNGIYSIHDLREKDISTVTIDQLKPFPELNQTLIWNRFNIPLKVSELHAIRFGRLNQYNFS